MAAPDHPKQPILRSLSAKLLVLTLVFVMLGEVFIYAPSVSRFRKVYLEGQIAAAHLATLALEQSLSRNVSDNLRQRLLSHTNTYNIVLRQPDRSIFVLGAGDLPPIDLTIDMRKQMFFGWIGAAFSTVFQTKNRILRVIGQSPKNANVVVEVTIDESPMRISMLDFSWRILGLSIVISFIAGGLVFLSLQWLMVRPMGRITASMTKFRANPEDMGVDIGATGRGDEIGVAQRELSTMQRDLRLALRQKERLAALGAAVAKVNHDLRNSLATAMLVSDRLTGSEDPEVKRLLPKLFNAIDKAVDLCSQTLNFVREGSPLLSPSCFTLYDLVNEVGQGITSSEIGSNSINWVNGIHPEMLLEADRELMYRAVNNLGRNAFQAGARTVTVKASERHSRICIEVSDDGPGLADKARQNLFTPFASTTKKDGTGLGLVIVRDLMRAHGGDLTLLKSDGDGTTFGLDLPEKIRDDARLWY